MDKVRKSTRLKDNFPLTAHTPNAYNLFAHWDYGYIYLRNVPIQIAK